MSVRVYLSGEDVRASNDFDSSTCRIGSVALSPEDDDFFHTLSDRGSIPQAIAGTVKEVTLKDSCLNREDGIYRFGSAKGELTFTDLFIRGKYLEDVLELRHRILTGAIRPDESYGGSQGGMSKAELEKRLERLQGELAEADERRKALWHDKCVAEDRQEQLRWIATKLTTDPWPFCRKSSVVKAIRGSFD